MFKLLIATPLYPPEIGGPATFTRFAEEELPKRDVAVAVEKFSDVRHLPKPIRYIVYFWRLVRAAGKVDVVFALDPFGIGLPALIAARLRGRRFLVRVVGDRAWETYASRMQKSKIKNQNDNVKFKNVDEFQYENFGLGITLRRWGQRFVARRAERVIVPSEFLKRIVSMWGVPEEKMSVVYNSFEPPQESETKDEARRALGLSGSIIVSAGRLVPWKGFSALIEIMPQIVPDIPDAKLVIIGDGPERERLRSQSAKCKAQSVVTLAGALPQNELHRYIRAADVFVLNSGYEGFSHQLLEAMALGTPIIASDIPGNRELIEDSRSGFLVGYNDADALLAALLRVLREEQVAVGLVGTAREKVAAFNRARIAERLVQVLVESTV
ncbi:MAG: glycosyltransferase family 4 protein [bacterium]|nr:glycosyltransferase family 4 protein [bacterium]MDZ4285151.1 glycosyltransferase family 4 protein [Patescibacteria group bacterium]